MGAILGTYHAKSGHPGGSLSAADIFTYLYFKELNVNPEDPAWEDRDLAAMFEAAHEAKGVCHNLYLTRLADVASQLTEELRPAEDHEPSEKRLAELADELARAHEATLDAIHAWAQAQ